MTKQHIVETKILPYFKDKSLKDITANDIAKWQGLIINTYQNKTYIKTINSQFSAIFNYAKKFYHLEINPIHITGSIGRRFSDRMDYYTVQEFHAFWDGIKDKPLSKIIFPLLFYSGMREGEMLALTQADFDYKNHTVTVKKHIHESIKKILLQNQKHLLL